MPGRRRRPSGSSTTRARPTRSARCTTAPRPWISWSRSRSAASPSRRPPPPASGRGKRLEHHRHAQATSTSPSRSSARCACSTAPCACSTATRAWSRRPRRSGARATSTACRASSSPTRWIRPAPTSTCALTTSRRSWAPGRCRCSSRSAPRSSFKGVIDLLTMKALIWEGEDKGAKFREDEIPADLADKAAEYRAAMIEAAVEMDDDAMGAYLDGKEPDVETLKRLIRKATVTSTFYPDAVRLGFQEQGRAAAARRGRGLSCPRRPTARRSTSSTPRPATETVRKPLDSEPLSMLAFKIMDDPHVGSHHLLPRLLGQGRERHGGHQHHARQEGAGRPHVSHARRRSRGAQRGVRGRHHRAGRPQGHAHGRDAVRPAASPCCSRRWTSPTPSSRWRSSPRPRPTRRRWALRCRSWRTEDPSFRVATDPESGQTIIKGMGELHLDIKVDILKRTHKVEVNVGAPQVAYRETLARDDRDRLHAQEADRRHRPVRTRQAAAGAQRGGHGQRVRERHRRRRVPKEYIPGVEKGVQSVWDSGVLIGFPMVDMKVTLYDGAYHEVDSSAHRLRDRRAPGHARRLREGRRQAARADHGRRGGDPRRVRRQRHRRPQQPARPIRTQEMRGNATWSAPTCRSPTCSAT